MLLLQLKHTNGASIPSRTFLPRLPGDRRWAPTVFLIACFPHPYSATPRLASSSRDVGLIRNTVVCCKCGSQMSWCVETNHKYGYIWRFWRYTSPSACSASTSIKHGSWFQQSPLNAELNFICYLLILLGAHHILHVSGIRVNFIEVLFLTYIFRSYEHDRKHVTAYEGISLSIQPDGGLRLSASSQYVCGGVPIRQSGPLHQVYL